MRHFFESDENQTKTKSVKILKANIHIYSTYFISKLTLLATKTHYDHVQLCK